MNGGLKSISAAALIAAAVSLGGVAAKAADLGGNCCADLEERVAELEATTARKGTRNVSLKISGTVGVNVIWHDSDANDAVRSDEITFHDAGDYDSEFTFSGKAKVSADIEMGFKLDFEADVDTNVEVDDMYLYIKSKSMGTVRFGRQDGAADGIHSISLANAIGQMTDNHSALVGSGFAYRNDFDGHSADAGIHYISPSVAGFIFSASYLTDADVGANATANNEERWSVALRYAGEFGALRVAAGVGYTESETKADEFVAGLSLMHVPTGLFVNGAYGEETDTGNDESGWTVVAGIEQKFFALGKTTLYGQYYVYEDGALDGYNWGLGVVQNIDAASAQMYLTYDVYECIDATSCTDDASVVNGGIKIKF